MTQFRQLPGSDEEVFFDHLAHFVPDMDAAHADLTRLGFTQTPYTLHSHTPDAEKEAVASGTANRCIMFPEGYIEIITVSDAATPLGARTARQMERYTGLHLLAFSIRKPDEAQGRLTFAGFHPEPLIHLERPVPTPDGGEDFAEFTVCRLSERDMAEGRIFFLAHHTPDLVWQKRWLSHDNGIIGLRDAVVCSRNLNETVARYSFFLDKGTPAQINDGLWRISIDRGGVVFADEDTIDDIFDGYEAPEAPSIAAYSLLTSDLQRTRAYFESEGFQPRELGSDLLGLILPESIGGAWLIAENERAFPWAK